MKALLASLPANMQLPRTDEIGVDFTILGFTLLISLGSAIFFGLIPAMQAWRVDLQDALPISSRSAYRRSTNLKERTCDRRGGPRVIAPKPELD